jgi:hypothetical protein
MNPSNGQIASIGTLVEVEQSWRCNGGGVRSGGQGPSSVGDRSLAAAARIRNHDF